MDSVQFCETMMLIIFGLSWPFNIGKSLKAKTAKGKSVWFEFVVLLGYAFGLTGKFIVFAETGDLPFPTYVYFLDILMVTIDIVLYFRNRKLDIAAAEGM